MQLTAAIKRTRAQNTVLKYDAVKSLSPSHDTTTTHSYFVKSDAHVPMVSRLCTLGSTTHYC